MASLTIHNIDPALKHEALAIMKEHGMTARATVESFLRRIVTDHQRGDRCFCHDLEPNEETRRALAETDAGEGLVRFNSVEDLFAHMDNECLPS
jgi:antitoxin component of RelBE/YafQ-DinJ toxin-antitoxin module